MGLYFILGFDCSFNYELFHFLEVIWESYLQVPKETL